MKQQLDSGVNIFQTNTISAPRLINFAPKNQDSSQQKNGNVQPVKGPDTVRGLSAGRICANRTSLPCSII